MFRRVLFIALFLAPGSLFAQTGALQGYANRGAWPATVSGLNSSNNFQNVIPSATITVYLTGSTTLATLYSDKNNTPLANPFTADASGSLSPGHWIFWASDTQAYDIVASGGISPNTYPSPVTLCTDCYPSNQFTVTTGVTSAQGTIPIQVDGASGTPATGAVTISCPTCGNLETFSTPPISGQHIIVYPVSVTPSSCGTSNSASGDDLSGQVYMVGAGSCGNSSDIWTFNTSALTALGINIANVTAVYPFVVSASQIQNQTGSGNSFLTACTGTGVTLTNNRTELGNNTSATYPLQQYTSSTSLTVSGTNFNAMNCSITASMVDSGVGGTRVISGNATLVGAYVYYTGSPVAQPNQVFVQVPLNFNSSTSTLSLPLPFDAAPDFGTANTYAVVNASFTQPVSGLEVKFYALNASSTTTPTLNLNGWGAWTIVGPTGGALTAGDITAYVTSHAVTRVILGGNNEWFLENPQVSGGGSSVSITSSLGSLTFTPSPLTGTGTADINYAHAGTWTALETFNAGIAIASGQGVTASSGGSTANCWNTNGSTTACGASGVLPSGVKGQTPVNDGSGATNYTAQSPTIGVANGGASITTAYTLLCDSATVGTGIQDRGKWAIVGTSGSVVLPDLAGTGCGGMYGGVLNSTTGSVTVSRQTSDTLNCYVPGSAPSTGQTSCTIPEGSWALFSPAISATAYDVKVLSGGGSGTPAGVNGNPQINASGSFGAQTNVFYAQSGDTITIINALCSTGATYDVSINLSLTLTANTTLNCNVKFEAGGEFTMTGAFTLTMAGQVNGPPTQHFSGSTVVFGSKTLLDYAEWFGAVGDCSATTCTTDNHVAMQAAINALGPGTMLQLLAKGYGLGTACDLTVTASNVGIIGAVPGHTGSGANNPSYFVCGSASATILDIGDTSTVEFDKFVDFTVERSVAPTNPSIGINAKNSKGMTTDRLHSEDSFWDFYFTGTPAFGTGVERNLSAEWGESGTCMSSGSPVGFYVDGSVSVLDSLRGENWTIANNCGSAITPVGLYLLDATDFSLKLLEGANLYYGVETSGTGNDITLREVRMDGQYCSAVLASTFSGALNIGGDGYLNGRTGNTCHAIDIETSSNVTIGPGTQINSHWGTAEVYLNGSSANSLLGLNLFGGCGAGGCVQLNNSSSNSISGLTINASGGDGIVLVGSSFNTLNGNTCNAVGVSGNFCLKADATSSHNHYLNNNASASGTTLLSDLGVDNQAAGSSGGTVTYTTSQTASLADSGKIVVMNCAAACAYTLPTTQPSSAWYAGVTTQGSTNATIAMGGSDTFNGSTSVPVLNKFRVLWVYANSATSTDYTGDAPLAAGSGITNTPASYQFAQAASGGGGGNYTNITGSITWTNCTISGSACVTSGSVGSITAASIPSTYNKLIVIYNGAASATATSTCQFNGDTSTNYTWEQLQANATTASAASGVSQTNTKCMPIGSLSGGGVLEIPFYAGSGIKTMTAVGNAFTSVSSGTSNFHLSISGLWNSTAAITQVVMTPGSGTFSTGLSISVYGAN